jgi:hypothetical protein
MYGIVVVFEFLRRIVSQSHTAMRTLVLLPVFVAHTFMIQQTHLRREGHGTHGALEGARHDLDVHQRVARRDEFITAVCRCRRECLRLAN